MNRRLDEGRENAGGSEGPLRGSIAAIFGTRVGKGLSGEGDEISYSVYINSEACVLG